MTLEELQEFAHKSRTDGRNYTLYKDRQVILEMCAIAYPRSIVECGFYCGHTTIELLKAGYTVTSVDRYYDEHTQALVSRIQDEYKNFTFIHDEWENVNIPADMCFLDGDIVPESSFDNYSWLVFDGSPNEPVLSDRWKLIYYSPKISSQRLYINKKIELRSN